MDYKTYAFTYTKSEIAKILITHGYTVKSMAKTLDLIPSLKDKKLEVFKEKVATKANYYKYPPAFYDIKFAWKTKDEFLDLSLALEDMAETWKSLPWRYANGDFYKSYAYRYSEVKKFMIEIVLGKLLSTEIKKITELL